MWCIYATEYYSSFKKSKIMKFGTWWMELEKTTLSQERKINVTLSLSLEAPCSKSSDRSKFPGITAETRKQKLTSVAVGWGVRAIEKGISECKQSGGRWKIEGLIITERGGVDTESGRRIKSHQGHKRS